jgi:sulfate adenylyltransferase subunit 1
MVTGASTADAVIILIDVSKVKLHEDGGVDLLIQTKRHSTIAHLLKIEHIVVAVNKMDLVGYDQQVYERIVRAYREFAATLGLKDITPIPLSALSGDNVVAASDKLSWYQGPTLIELLESLSVYDESHQAPFRFPVQLVARHNGHEANDFRGYMGRIEAGSVSVGDQLVVQPSGQLATVRDIVTLEGSHATAVVGQSVTILLNEHLDISRGDMLAGAAQPATLLRNVVADVCWMSDEPLDLRRKYWIKHGTRQSAARVTSVDSILDINTQQRHAAEGLRLNDIARIALTVQQPLAADAYDDIRATALHPDRRSDPPDRRRGHDPPRRLSGAVDGMPRKSLPDRRRTGRPGPDDPARRAPAGAGRRGAARRAGHARDAGTVPAGAQGRGRQALRPAVDRAGLHQQADA